MDNQKNDIDKIKEVIDMLRPFINGDGGDLEFVKYEDKYVYIKFSNVYYIWWYTEMVSEIKFWIGDGGC